MVVDNSKMLWEILSSVNMSLWNLNILDIRDNLQSIKLQEYGNVAK